MRDVPQVRRWLKWVWALAAMVMISGQPALADDLSVSNGQRVARVSAIGEGVVRVRIHPVDAEPEDASWAVPAEQRARRAAVHLTANSLTTARISVAIDPQTLALDIRDNEGRALLSSAAEPWRAEGNGFAVRLGLNNSEQIFGMGDKTGLLNRRGRSFTNWNTDFYGFRSSDDPIYKSIPFYISSGSAGGAYGVLLDNSWRSWFDFGAREADVLSFGAENGPIDFYVIAGPAIADVVRGYVALTGPAPLPPRWALGYQQSRWSYMSEAEVRALAARLRAERIPTDVIWLDIDFQDRNRPFTVDRRTFPQFEAMVSDLLGMGISTVAIADLHIARAPDDGYAPYDSGVAGDHFLRLANGEPYVGPVWPGPSVFPEFTRTATRRWWGDQMAHLATSGIAGIWNDMNEPAIFESPIKTMPPDVRHRIDTEGFAPRTATHAEIHNVYGMENTRATFEGLQRLRPDERPFVMTRASFAGGHRYAATWTGDNSATWDHLRLAVQQTLNLGLSGFAWAGADVGGFTGGPTPDLLTRWYQYATFAPIFRNHSQKDVPRAEPWFDGPEHLAIRRRFVEERYRLMPYFYAVAEDNARTGNPLMRPLFYDYPEALGFSCDMGMSFTFGSRLLIAGAPRPEAATPYQACLPTGGWYDYWTGQLVTGTVAQGGTHSLITLNPDIATLPVFVRAGTILPRQPLVQSTRQRPEGPLELHIYPGSDCRGELYDDDGHSMGFARGEFLRQALRCDMNGHQLQRLRLERRQGRYTPWWSSIRITVHGGSAYRATLRGRAIVSSDGQSFDVPDLTEGSISFTPLR